MAARLASRAGVRPVIASPPARRAGLTWPRLPAAAELATIGAGYAAYSLVRLAIRAGRPAAFAHAAQLWQAERLLHLTAEPYLNHLAAAHSVLADAAGYYYGLAHFLVTPLVLAWLYLRRPAAFPRLRSGLVLATAAANVMFWAWPAAPPRFSVPGMTDILDTRDILGAAHPTAPPAWLTCTPPCPACTSRGPPGAPSRSSPRAAAGGAAWPGCTRPSPCWWCWARPTISCWMRAAGSPSRAWACSLPVGPRSPSRAATRHATAHDGRRPLDGR